MKKDKKWIHKEVDKLRIYSNPDIPTRLDDFYGQYLQYVSGVNSTAEEVLGLINQLDEPEVLSQELPVIPKYVAEYVNLVKIDIPLMKILAVANRRNELPEWKKEYDWISANDEMFARAWLDGYTVAEEQKYYVDLDMAAYVAKWNGDDQVDIYTDDIFGSDEFEFFLTEQEIKNYDERFWPFAEPAEQWQ